MYVDFKSFRYYFDIRRWGATISKFRRILPVAYLDYKGKFRINDRKNLRLKSLGYKPILLPNARTLSSKLHYSKDEKSRISDTSTLMLMQFGQFVDHDIALSPEDGNTGVAY